MEASKLSQYYSIASERCHKTLTEFYEACHDNSGNPVTDTEKVGGIVGVTLTRLHHELDLCVEAVKEYNGE